MRVKMSKQPPPAPTARAVGPCPTLIQTSRTPRHWKFTQDHRTTRPPPTSKRRGCSFDTEANKFYDRTNRLYDAALLTRCYTQHALRPVIDSKINHIRQFIKIPFINKGMDFIDLPSIFRDKSVQSSIPNYFKNCEVPIICYKYNKPIRGAIFNFNKLVSDLDIETCTPDS